MTLKRTKALRELLDRHGAVIEAQNMLIEDLQQEIRRIHLDYNREVRGLVCSWLIHLEKPELDLRHDLAELDTILANRVAELEEHVL